MSFWKNINDKKTLTIDLGSKYIRCAIFENGELVKKYLFESDGIEYGLISNEKLFSEKLTDILQEITFDFELIPKNIIISLSTAHQNSASLSVTTFTKRVDGIITDLDIDNIKSDARKKIEHLKDKIVLHEIIIKNKVDGNPIIGDLKKIKGFKIESKVLFVYDDMHNYKLLERIFNSLNMEIDKVVSGPLMEAEILLTDREKRLGTAVVNIGHHVSSLCVYEKGSPLLVSCAQYGGENITSEISLFMRVDPDTAEEIKLDFNLKDYSKRRCEEIVENSIFNYAEHINSELDRIKRRELLPGGIRITGGSAGLTKIENYLKYDLRLPAINTEFDSRYTDLIDDMSFIKNHNAERYSDNINDLHIYKNLIKNNYLKIETFLKKFAP